MYHTTLTALCLSIALVSSANNLQADVVLANLDYNAGFSGTTMTGAAVEGDAGDFWNASPTFFNFLGTETNGNTGDTVANLGPAVLNDTSGAASGISYQMTFVNDGFGFNGAFENLGAVSGSSAANLVGDYLFVGTADAGDSLDFEIFGLDTNTDYNLYLYGNGDAAGQGATWTLNGSSQTSAFDGTTSLDEGGEFVVFSFNTGASTTQSFTATEFAGNIAINGFQLALDSTAVPEPSSFALIGLVGLAGLLKRRRLQS